MFDKIKKWFDDIIKKMGITVPDDKKTDLETALKEFAASLEKEGKEGDDGDNKKAGEAFTEAIKKALEGAIPKTDPKPDEKTGSLDADKLTAALTTALKPFQDEVGNLKKEFESMSKLRKEQEDSAATKKLQDTLKSAHEKGKISSAQVKEYNDILEEALKEGSKAFDITLKTLKTLPDNAIIAKQNKAAGFSLDGKPKEDGDKGGDNKADNKDKMPKPVMGSVDPVYLKQVNEDIGNN